MVSVAKILKVPADPRCEDPVFRHSLFLRWMVAKSPVDRWFIHVYPIICRVSTIQGGAGFLPSTLLDGWGTLFVAPTGSPLNREYVGNMIPLAPNRSLLTT